MSFYWFSQISSDIKIKNDMLDPELSMIFETKLVIWNENVKYWYNQNHPFFLKFFSQIYFMQDNGFNFSFNGNKYIFLNTKNFKCH